MQPQTLEDLQLAREFGDAVIAKALKVGELKQVARIETRTVDFLVASWAAQAKKAIKVAAKATEDGKSIETVTDKVDDAMKPWANKAIPVVKRANKDIYKLARVVGWKRATGILKGKHALAYTSESKATPGSTVIKAKDVAEVFPGFTLADEQAIQALNGHNTFWIGSHYSDKLSKSIAEVIRDTIIAEGSSRFAAAKALEKALKEAFGKITIPSGFSGSASGYFAGLSANTATVARVAGQLNSFAEFDVTEYEVVNPGDERTSPICQHMNGKVFTVVQGKQQLDSELATSSPHDIKTIHPWMKLDAVKAISPKAGHVSKADSQALASAGLPIPPYHFRCRTTIDVK